MGLVVALVELLRLLRVRFICTCCGGSTATLRFSDFFGVEPLGIVAVDSFCSLTPPPLIVDWEGGAVVVPTGLPWLVSFGS